MTEAAASVELIPIKSQTRTIQACFQQCLYKVPNFQRPYSWSLDQLEDFWNDVVLAQGDFFFGSTVTWVSEQRDLFNDTYSIIDGQQRLTTSAIALSVIRDAFYDIAERAKGDPALGGAAELAVRALRRRGISLLRTMTVTRIRSCNARKTCFMNTSRTRAPSPPARNGTVVRSALEQLGSSSKARCSPN